ncbi:MAG: serine/threonine-protein kinase [Deltaproteobacteria bacterium]|jgi:serine/threonine protein kinase
MTKNPFELLQPDLGFDPPSSPTPDGTRVFEEQTADTLSNFEPSDSTSPDPWLGRVVSGCRFQSYLASGGHANVYRGVHLETGAAVAIKVLRPDAATRGELRRRFLREAQALAALASQPGIVRIRDFGSNEVGPYVVLDLVAGSSLDEHLRTSGALEPEHVFAIGAQIAESLAAVHAAGLAHRDLKPGNVVVDAELSRATLVDFGLVSHVHDEETRLTFVGARIGTPGFLPPEPRTGDAGDPARDCFALGRTLQCMATGVREPDEAALVPLDPRLQRIVARLVTSNPAARATAQDALVELRRLARGRVRRGVGGWTAAMLVVPVAAIAVAYLWSPEREERPRPSAPTAPAPRVEIVPREPPTEPVKLEPKSVEAPPRRRRPRVARPKTEPDKRASARRALRARGLRMADIEHLHLDPASGASFARAIETLTIDRRMVASRLDRVASKLSRLANAEPGKVQPLELIYFRLRKASTENAVQPEALMRDVDAFERRLDTSGSAL